MYQIHDEQHLLDFFSTTTLEEALLTTTFFFTFDFFLSMIRIRKKNYINLIIFKNLEHLVVILKYRRSYRNTTTQEFLPDKKKNT